MLASAMNFAIGFFGWPIKNQYQQSITIEASGVGVIAECLRPWHIDLIFISSTTPWHHTARVYPVFLFPLLCSGFSTLQLPQRSCRFESEQSNHLHPRMERHLSQGRTSKTATTAQGLRAILRGHLCLPTGTRPS